MADKIFNNFSFDDNYEIIVDYTINEKDFVLKTKNEQITSEYVNKIGRNSKRDKFILGKTKYKHRVCRFCGKSSKDVKFGHIAHVIPQMLGNNTLFSDYECNDCNHNFGQNLENDLSNFLSNFNRMVEGIKGKKGSPNYTSVDKKTKISLEDILIKINTSSFNSKPVFTVEGNEINLFIEKEKYIPLKVYKCLIRIALTLLPDEEIIFDGVNIFRDITNWLLDENIPNPCNISELPLWYHQDFSISFPLRTMIFRRKENSLPVPYLVFILLFGNTYIQICLPYDPVYQHLTNRETHLFPYPIHLDYGIDVNYKHSDFSSATPTIGDSYTITFEFKGEASHQKFKNRDEYNMYLNLSDEEKSIYNQKHNTNIISS